MAMAKRWIDDFLSLPSEELVRHAQSQLKNGFIPLLIDQHRVIDWKPSSHKYACSDSRTFAEIMYKVRATYQGGPSRGLLFMCNNSIVNPSFTIGQLYQTHISEHGFLIITIMEEHCFG